MFSLSRILSICLLTVFVLAGCDKAANPNAAMETMNKELYMKTIEAFRTGNPDLFKDVLADDFVEHNPDPNIPGSGKEHWKNQVVEYKKSFPDMEPTIEHILAKDDMVWSHFRVKGTNTGPMGGMPATGKVMNVEGIEIMRFKDGKAVERWGVFDAAGMMTQLGMMPSPDSQKMDAQKPQ